jgi:microcompartment protein CcmK/EutM
MRTNPEHKDWGNIMILGMVVGTVVSNKRADQIEAARYLLIDQCDQQGTGKKDFLVALDLIGAGYGEMVLLSQGSAARQTTITDNRPMDAVIVGIVDLIDESGKVVYKKQ